MKQILYFGLIATAFIACSTPGTESKTEAADTRMEDAILKKAMKRRDVATILNTIHVIMEKDSTRTGLNDTLFEYYVQMQNPEGAADVGQIILASRPNDTKILEPTAIALSAIMQYETSLVLHQRLFALSGDPRIKLNNADLLYAMNRIDEARAEINWIIEHREVTDTMMVDQPSPTGKDGVQQISMLAVGHYSLGKLEHALGNTKKALVHWNKAWEIAPRYHLAAESILKYGK